MLNQTTGLLACYKNNFSSAQQEPASSALRSHIDPSTGRFNLSGQTQKLQLAAANSGAQKSGLSLYSKLNTP